MTSPTERAETEALIARGQRVLMGNYGRQPVTPVRGEGAFVWDLDGRRYLDFIGGIAVSVLGHNHPALAKTIAEQAAKILHVSNLYWIEPQVALAERICQHSFAERLFFCNSGAEANEFAVKAARRHFYDAGDPERFHIVSADASFHGRTLAMLAATGTPKYREGFGPMPGGFSQVPFGDVEALRATVDARTAAVLLEPVQGEGGLDVPPPGYIAAAREICDAAGALLILDEVQVGIGRTGKLFAHEHEGVTPDIMTLAKGLGGGVPVAAVATTEAVQRAMVPGTHGSTFGGNYLSCAAACTVFDIVTSEGFLDGVMARGDALRAGLQKIVDTRPFAAAVRGRGMLCGLQMAEGHSSRALAAAARERGLLCGVATDRVLRLAPPLNVGDDAIEFCLDTLTTLPDDAARA